MGRFSIIKGTHHILGQNCQNDGNGKSDKMCITWVIFVKWLFEETALEIKAMPEISVTPLCFK